MTDWNKEIDKLAKYLLINWVHELREDENAIDMAIRLLEAAQQSAQADKCPICAGERIVDKGQSMQRICVDCLVTGIRR